MLNKIFTKEHILLLLLIAPSAFKYKFSILSYFIVITGYFFNIILNYFASDDDYDYIFVWIIICFLVNICVMIFRILKCNKSFFLNIGVVLSVITIVVFKNEIRSLHYEMATVVYSKHFEACILGASSLEDGSKINICDIRCLTNNLGLENPCAYVVYAHPRDRIVSEYAIREDAKSYMVKKIDGAQDSDFSANSETLELFGKNFFVFTK